MARYLVTGGCGFIGSHICENLIQLHQEVILLDNLETGSLMNIASFQNQLKFIQGDIRNSETLEQIMDDVDYVIHQAAIPSVPRSVENPQFSNSNNIDGTLALLVAARDANVKRFVFASSSSVYGSDQLSPRNEAEAPNPRSPYALTKLTCEYYCRIFTEIYHLETVCLRYFNVFGPRQNIHSQYAAVIPNFVQALQHDKPAVIYSDGEQTRDFTYVKNVVQANLKAAITPGIAGQILNIGCGQRTSVNQLFYLISGFMNSSMKPEYRTARSGDVRHSCADISRALILMGYEPQTSLEDGLIETIRYFTQKANGAKI